MECEEIFQVRLRIKRIYRDSNTLIPLQLEFRQKSTMIGLGYEILLKQNLTGRINNLPKRFHLNKKFEKNLIEYGKCSDFNFEFEVDIDKDATYWPILQKRHYFHNGSYAEGSMSDDFDIDNQLSGTFKTINMSDGSHTLRFEMTVRKAKPFLMDGLYSFFLRPGRYANENEESQLRIVTFFKAFHLKASSTKRLLTSRRPFFRSCGFSGRMYPDDAKNVSLQLVSEKSSCFYCSIFHNINDDVQLSIKHADKATKLSTWSFKSLDWTLVKIF